MQGRVEASSNPAATQHTQPAVPSGANHPPSNFCRLPGSENGGPLAHSSIPQNMPAPSQQYLWMSQHRKIPAEAFPPPSRAAQLVKIEAEPLHQSICPPLGPTLNIQPSQSEPPLATVEVEDGYDDSAMDQYSRSDESRSESDADSDDDSDEGSNSGQVSYDRVAP